MNKLDLVRQYLDSEKITGTKILVQYKNLCK